MPNTLRDKLITLIADRLMIGQHGTNKRANAIGQAMEILDEFEYQGYQVTK